MFAHTNLITYESLYSSSYLLNENLLYDKLWGPSQREVTLLHPLLTAVQFHFQLMITGLPLWLVLAVLKTYQRYIACSHELLPN